MIKPCFQRRARISSPSSIVWPLFRLYLQKLGKIDKIVIDSEYFSKWKTLLVSLCDECKEVTHQLKRSPKRCTRIILYRLVWEKEVSPLWKCGQCKSGWVKRTNQKLTSQDVWAIFTKLTKSEGSWYIEWKITKIYKKEESKSRKDHQKVTHETRDKSC